MAGGQERILRGRINSMQATKKITRAMELIAASRIVKAQQRVEAAVPYSEQITEAVKGHIDKGEMTINADGKPLMPGTADLEKLLPQYIDAQLAIFAGNALLEA